MSSPAYDKVRLTPFGYYELSEKPGPDELREYYAAKYYQQSVRTHQHSYEEDELAFRSAKLEQKRIKVKSLIGDSLPDRPRFLDVGAGEGFALAHFEAAGWDVIGMDFSSFGCGTHHPRLLDRMIVGDISDSLTRLAAEGARFDLILLDNVLEHVPDPLALLTTVRRLMRPHSVLIIEVPNDFSVLQMHLLESGRLPRPFWVVAPDHISYFNHSGLRALAAAAGLDQRAVLGDFPIDFALCNENTNYAADKSLGKACHRMRVEIDNLIHRISPERANDLYEALGNLGLGRQIVGFFQPAPAGV